MTAVFRLTVKAIDIPNFHLIHIPNCYAQITTDGEHDFSTKTIRGPSPEWNERFDISLNQSSVITIRLIHVLSASKEVLRGTALIPVRDWLPQVHETTSRKQKLKQIGMRFRKGAFVVLSITKPNPVAPVQIALQPNEVSKKVTDEVLLEVSRAEAAAANLKSHNGMLAVDDLSATSSDLFSNVLGHVEKVVQLGDILSQVHPYARLAWKVLTVAHKAVRGQVIRDDKIRRLLIAMHDMLGFVEETDAVSKINMLQNTVSSMMAEIHECAQFIQKYGEKRLCMRVMRDNLSIATDDRVEQFIETFKRLKENFNQGVNLQTLKLLEEIHVHVTDSDKVLENLPGWNLEGVKFDESKACLRGTRQQLIGDIHHWVNSPNEGPVLWLSGGAGTGKTSVANSIAVFFDSINRLAACFCFNRDTAGLNSPNYIFGNLCYQLAHFDEHGQFGLKGMIVSAIRSMGYIASSSLQTQAKKLIVDTTKASKLEGPVVVVIDGLDESGTTQTRKRLLEAIAMELPRLPQSIKVMITSRDEPDIRALLQDSTKEVCIDDAKNTPEDITSYVRHRLRGIQRRLHLREDWPGLEKSKELSSRAGRLFIWASVACNFVEEKRNPIWRLDRLLDTTSDVKRMTGLPLESLDILYSSILTNAFPDEDDPLTDFRYIVGSIVTLEAPLTQTGLESLLGVGYSTGGDFSILQDVHKINLSSSHEILSLLRPVLKADYTETTGRDGPLRLLHPSFYEFLTSRASGNFRINPLEQNWILAIRCLEIMNTQLRFDICNIGNPSLLNEEVTDLRKRIDENISEGLHYSCCSLGYHIKKVSELDMILRTQLKTFILEHLLHWIEVMSLLGEITSAEGNLDTIGCWIEDFANDEVELRDLVGDAIPFLRNSGNGIRLSALHTYFSALPLTPKTSKLFACFIHKEPHVPSIVSSHPIWPATSVRVMEGHTGPVWSVVFSPDGKKLVSAAYDATMRVWNVESGQEIGEALTGHTHCVRHAVFSPDGQMLASASFDKTVRIWDSKSGQAIGKPLGGHTKRVCHVTFSPDGKKLASVSDDATLRLWDPGTGKAIGEALKGHWGNVTHIEFSPDGTKLASASYDATVRLWNIDNRQAIGKALVGHYGRVCHVVFSTDGKKLASASMDTTVRLWDIASGKEISEVLEGHVDRVECVMFSPDGKKLASASYDGTVRLWDIGNSPVIVHALRGHTGHVSKVIFSPDGRKLASASEDATVRLWDAESGEAIGKALEGHTSWVNYVAFSPDGKRLASASDDETVRVWDIESDQAAVDTKDAHTRHICHIVFSPNGKKLVSASEDKTLRIWNAENGQAIGEALIGHKLPICHVVFSPDGKKLASASCDTTVQLWDIEGGRTSGEALRGHTDWVSHVVFSPDGKTLASASGDQTVRLWDVESGLALGPALVGHNDCVCHVMFSKDGKLIASTSSDQMIRLWDVKSGQCFHEGFELYTEDIMRLSWAGVYESPINSADDLPESTSNSIVNTTMSFDHQGFLRHGPTRLLWLPFILRGVIAVHSSVVAIGGGSGAVTFIWP